MNAVLFIADNIPDESAKNLCFAIIYDSVGAYARALVELKRLEKIENLSKYEKSRKARAEFTKAECESFFRGNWYRELADVLEFKFSGTEIIKMVQKSPKKFFKAQSGGRKCKYDY